MLLKKMKEMESEVEAYKALKEDYNHLEGYCSDLKLQIREKELQAQIEIEKAIAKKESCVKSLKQKSVRQMPKMCVCRWK